MYVGGISDSQGFPNHSHSDYPLKGDDYFQNCHLEGEIFSQKFPFLGESIIYEKFLTLWRPGRGVSFCGCGGLHGLWL